MNFLSAEQMETGPTFKVLLPPLMEVNWDQLWLPISPIFQQKRGQINEAIFIWVIDPFDTTTSARLSKNLGSWFVSLPYQAMTWKAAFEHEGTIYR